MKTIQVITLFPEMFSGSFNSSMLWKAQHHEITKLETIDLRTFGLGKRHNVDDIPYGGGDGMLLRVEPIFAAVDYAQHKQPNSTVLLMTPRGKDYTQLDAKRLSDSSQDIIIICGRYEGYDERITAIVDEQICIGHYVLTGGEIAALAVVDSVVRLLPGVLGGATSAEIESFSDANEREYPQYTRPVIFHDLEVPNILLSGNHAAIAKWRHDHTKRD